MKAVRIGAVVVLAAALVAPMTLAQDSDETGSQNYRQLAEHRFGPNVVVTLVIGQVDDEEVQPRTYRLVARDRGPRAEMLIGWRMPIPTAHSADGDATGTTTEYIYQNIGVTARVRVEVLDDGRVLLEGEIEASGSRDNKPANPSEQPGDAPPVIGTFQQALSVLMVQNEPLRVAEVPDPDGGVLFVQLEVDVQE